MLEQRARSDITLLLEEIDDALNNVSSIDHRTRSVDRILLKASAIVLQRSREDCADPLVSNFACQRACAEVRTLWSLANEQINSLDFHLVSLQWLSLYTDTSILSALSQIVCHHGGSLGTSNIVKTLDMAIIVGGATGLGRMHWIQTAIGIAQKVGYDNASEGTPAMRHHNKRRRLDVETTGNRAPLFAPRCITELPTPPSLAAYLANYSQTPFILKRHLASDASPSPPWPAIHRWSDASYLLSRVGPDRWVPVETGSAYDDHDWGQQIVPFDAFLKRAGFDLDFLPKSPVGEQPMYLAQHSLFRQFPALERDIVLPDYVWSAPPVPASCPAYTRPTTPDGVIVNVWIGSGEGDIVSPPHTDPYYNCYAQVLGEKRVWIAPPECGPYMACHGSDTGTNVPQDKNDLAAEYMSNTSTLPVLRQGTDRHTLAGRYPEFMNKVWPLAQEAILSPGDLLVMPPGWWHAMRGEGHGPGWSVSMWY